MSDLLKIAVEKWCDEVRAHDNWTWGNTCADLLRGIDYTATSRITRENIRVTLTDGKPVELLRLEHGWGIRWGKDAAVPVAPKGNHVLTCQFCSETDFDELGLEIHLANYCMSDQSPKLNSLAYREAAQTVEVSA